MTYEVIRRVIPSRNLGWSMQHMSNHQFQQQAVDFLLLPQQTRMF